MHDTNIEQWVLSAIIIFAAFIVRYLIKKAIEKTTSIKSNDLKRRWNYHSKSWVLGLTLILLMIIWGSELRSFMLGIITFLVAIIIATKELILCITGGIFRVIASPFKIGDRIEVNGFQGEIIDQSIMMTRLLETGPGDFDEFKGSVITLPNSVFLLHPIRNKNLTDDFVLHQIRIPFKNSENLEAKRNLLLSIANKICSKYLDQAITVFNKSIHRNFMKINISPDVSCEFLEPERIDLVLKLPVPKKERFSIQQKIIKEFLENLTQ